MPQYTYTARAVNGDLKSATLEAPNRDKVVKQLRQQRLNVLKIDEGTAVKKKRGGKIKMRDIVIFTRQFSTMINAGLPLVQALDILATQSENPALKDVTRQVVFDVESETQWPTRPQASRRVYRLVCNMVAAGEAGWYSRHHPHATRRIHGKNDALIRR
jgi:type IV pilus assembly protein PilC